MPINELHRRVATVALRVATRYGFALGGGNALIAHGLITRPTMDVDLFTNEETGVEAAAGAVESALREAGFGDTAAALKLYSVGDAIGLARRLDPGLDDRDFADAARRLDRWGDGIFAAFGLSAADVAALRAAFRDWPR
jgi:hypothetical protein